MVDILHRIGIKAPAPQVYKALTTLEGLAHWWTEEVPGDTQVGGKIEFRFRTKSGELLGGMVVEVQELGARLRRLLICFYKVAIHLAAFLNALPRPVIDAGTFGGDTIMTILIPRTGYDVLRICHEEVSP